jgi:hypothetical protein
LTFHSPTPLQFNPFVSQLITSVHWIIQLIISSFARLFSLSITASYRAMSLADSFILSNVRELLGPACDPQLRLVSKKCNAAMATFPREQMRLEDFLSSLALFLWATQVLEIPWSRE